jgi:cyclopropane-fatty-acyl-phospholipid synthase
MFEAFLSEDMMYSCAIFRDLDGDLQETGARGSGGKVGVSHEQRVINGCGEIKVNGYCHGGVYELEEAQMRKIQ